VLPSPSASGKLFDELARPAESARNQLRAVLNRRLRNTPPGSGRLHESESSAKEQSLKSQRREERHEGGNGQSYECKYLVHALLLLRYAKGNGTRKARRRTLIKGALADGAERAFVEQGPRRGRADTTASVQMR
jgi:hypothetical protein